MRFTKKIIESARFKYSNINGCIVNKKKTHNKHNKRGCNKPKGMFSRKGRQ